MAEASLVEEPRIKKNKCSFDANFKLKVVNYAEKNTNRSAVTKFEINERDWRKRKADLQQIPAKKKRLEGGRKAAFPAMEKEILAWIENLRSKNLRVTRSAIQKQAVELIQGINIT